jgi:hypothetical protein
VTPRPVGGRGRQLAVAVRPTLRGVRWELPATAGSLVVLLLFWKHAELESPASGLWLVRGSALLLTLGALALLDDPAARQVAAVPLPLAWRSTIRLTSFVTIVFVPVIWLAAWANLSVTGLLLETSTIVAASCAASLAMTRASEHSEPSTIVSIGLLPLPGVLALLPRSAALLVPPGGQWTAAHQRWAVLCTLAAVALALALRDPAARMSIPRGRPSPSA